MEKAKIKSIVISHEREKQIPRRRAGSRQHRFRAAKYNFNLIAQRNKNHNNEDMKKTSARTTTRAACFVSHHISTTG
jgi:hypothetical protein